MNPAATAAAGAVYTYEDYRKLPEGSPYQLIGGKLVMTPAPSPYHQIVAANLGFLLMKHCRENNLGLVLFSPVDVYLEETETYQPDVIFITKERKSIVHKEKINGAPDLVVEVLSPHTAYYDLRKKFRAYERHGVKEYWIVDPEEESVEIFVLREGGFHLDQREEKEGRVYSRVAEGFSVAVEEIFAGRLD
ncbi:Uma2 family endonuclease [Desulfovirgula thermocuniculi]|uniref:Uma2 family endonuclease n=1 Tax=Desulfovirgula thermocuniculi TaxID=348842 RepID=UPI0003F60B30|nr:Uma2 family endonuclease [Desulfovirgula thermocuniculi]